MKRLLVAIALLTSTAQTASAQWVFDNGPAALLSVPFYDFSVQPIYSQFYLASPTLITSIQYNAWWIRDVSPNPYIGYTGQTLWSVWADNGGSRGAARAGGLTAGTWDYGGGIGEPGYGPVGYCGSFDVNPCYQHDLSFNGFTLSAGTYWLGLQNGAKPDPYAEQYYLAPSVNGVAFRLGGQALGDTVVPEPATFALFASGLVGIAAARRRKKQKAGDDRNIVTTGL